MPKSIVLKELDQPPKYLQRLTRLQKQQYQDPSALLKIQSLDL